ncbi:MAG TPA: O-methyltransferase [Ilumatobacter sp.]|nr:O-methyltransferase [Ilumatobacter sp.]
MRFIELNNELYEYVLASANPATDPVTEQLAATTRDRFGAAAGMNVGADQGAFLSMLVAITGAQTVVEVGTFTGMSATWLARGLPAGGRLICCDITDDYLATAHEAWDAAGVSDRIEFRQGPALDTLAAMPTTPHIDMAFIDADKPGYLSYLLELLPRLTERGFVVVDNVLWSGQVIDDSDQSESTVALREFNDHVARRDDVVAVLLPIGDGVTIIRRR